MDGFWEILDAAVGLQPNDAPLSALQTAIRAALLYLIGYLLLRLGEHRFLGKNTAFDVILGFIFGAMLSRAINGVASFGATVLAAVVLLSMHWLISTASYYSDTFDRIVNGEAVPLIENGAIIEENLKDKRINDRTLNESLRLRGYSSNPSAIKRALFERNGSISVVSRQRDVQVVEVELREGVQTIRLELSRPEPNSGAGTNERGP